MIRPLTVADLPLRLPELEDFKPTGSPEGPLVKATDWVYVSRDGKRYRRDPAALAERLTAMAMLDPILPRLWQLARRLKTAGSAPGQNFKRSGVFPSRKGQAKTCQFRGWARKTLIATFSAMSLKATRF